MWLDLGIAVGSDDLDELRPRQPSHLETREALMDIVRGSSHASEVTQHCLVRRHRPKLPIARISMCPSMGWRSRRSSARADYPCVVLTAVDAVGDHFALSGLRRHHRRCARSRGRDRPRRPAGAQSAGRAQLLGRVNEEWTQRASGRRVTTSENGLRTASKH